MPPPRPEVAEPRASFDPGRFSVGQTTLPDLEECSGLDFDKLKEFDVLAAQPIPRSVLQGAHCVTQQSRNFTEKRKGQYRRT
jgi:hypothetical protein